MNKTLAIKIIGLIGAFCTGGALFCNGQQNEGLGIIFAALTSSNLK